MDVTPYRRAVIDASDADLLYTVADIKTALEGDSNDAEHEALAGVAELLGIEWKSPYDDDICPNCGGPEGYPSDHAVGCPLSQTPTEGD